MKVVAQPLLLKPRRPSDQRLLKALRKRRVLTIDTLPRAREALFRIELPHIPPGSPEYLVSFNRYQKAIRGRLPTHFVYFPWRNTLVHLPSEEVFNRLQSARNRFLITDEEQSKFRSARIGIAGLSVGAVVALSLVLNGGPMEMRLADPDAIEPTNLNRLPFGVTELEMNKTIACSRRLYELNPYLNLKLFPQGLREKNFKGFFIRGKKFDLFVEEMDDLLLKIKSRLFARKNRIATVMATDNGDNTIVDVERFDLEPKRPIFHGRVSEREIIGLGPSLSLVERIQLADKIVGPQVTTRMQDSLELTGSMIPAWPQLGTAAITSAAAVTYVARRILTGQAMPSGRYTVDHDLSFDPGYHGALATRLRAQRTKEFVEGFKLIFK